MVRPRGTTHTTLTETASEVVSILKSLQGIKMIAPGIITQNKGGNAGKRFVTISITQAGFELLITGQGIQKVSIHAEKNAVVEILEGLKSSKKLKNFSFKQRDRKPGI